MSSVARWAWLRAQNGYDGIQPTDAAHSAALAQTSSSLTLYSGNGAEAQSSGIAASPTTAPGGPEGVSNDGMPGATPVGGAADERLVTLLTVAPASVLAAVAGNVTINLEFDAAAQGAPQFFRTDLQQAATMMAAAMHVPKPVTFNITIQYNENGIGSGSADGGPSPGLFESYATVRSDLIATAPAGDTNFNALPKTSSIQGQSQVAVWNAQLKVFGLLAGNATGVDGNCNFSATIPSTVLVAVGLHEIAHALGRVPYGPPDGPQPDIFDLFRFTSPGRYLFDDNLPASSSAYFSVNGGNTKLADYGVHSDPSDFLNAYASHGDPASPLTPEDPFDQVYDSKTVQSLTTVDLTQLDVLGFGTSTPASPLTFELGNFGASASAGGWTSENTYPRQLGDVNGDGKDDIVGFGSNGVYVSLATGGGTFASPIFATGGFGTDSGGWTSQDTYPREVADVNGDGKADIVGFGSNGVYVALGKGDGTFGNTFLATGGFGTDNGGWTSQNTYPRELADLTGNGRNDIVAFGSDGVYVALANSDGTFGNTFRASTAFGTNSGWTSQNLYPRELADVTGNGRADIVAFGSNGVYVALANSDGTFGSPFLAITAFGTGNGWTSQDTYPRELADVNGDGRADIVAFGSDGTYTALANSNGTFQSPVFDFSDLGASPATGGFNSNNTYPRLLGDVTGDHKADVVAFASDGVYFVDSSHLVPPT